MREEPEIQDRSEKWAAWLAAISLALGAVALVGWILDVPTLRSVVVGLSEMKANTALGSIFGACALLGVVVRQRRGGESDAGGTVVWLCGALVALIGGLTLVQYFAGWNLGIDEALVRDRSVAPFTEAPGRMGRNTALGFLLLGTAFVTWDWKRYDPLRPAHWLALVAAGVGFAGLLGYFFSVTVLLELRSFTGMSVPTALAQLAVSVGALLMQPDSVLARVLRASGPAGLLARRLLPAILLLPILIGWLRLLVERVGLAGSGSGVSGMVAALVLAQAWILYAGVAETERVEAERSAHEEASRRSRAELRESMEQLARHDSRMEALATASHTFAEAGLDFQEILDRLTRAVAEEVGDFCSIRLLDGDGRLVVAALHHPDEEVTGRLEAIPHGHEPEPDDLFGWVLESGDPVFVPESPPAALRTRVPEVFHAPRDPRPVHALIVVALRAHDKRVGALTAWRESPGNPYTEHDLILLQDLADQAALAVDNARLYDASQAAVEAKANFLAVISHELRTPLNGALGHADLLQAGIGGQLSDLQGQFVGRIKLSIDHLRRIVDELIEYAQLEAGAEKLEPRDVALGDVVGEATAMVRTDLDQKGLSLRTDVPEAIRLEVDPQKLRQVLLNLLTNAIRFTEEGSIRVSGTRSSNGVEVVVADTGIGIAEEHHRQIFEPFWQVEQANTRRYGGTGLGLSLSRRLARAMGGDIDVRSEAGEGSAFVLRLPHRHGPEPDPTDR